MAKRKRFGINTTFERIPVEVARKIADQEKRHEVAGVHFCALCCNPVELEHCRTNEFGKAVHQDCYADSLNLLGKETSASTR